MRYACLILLFATLSVTALAERVLYSYDDLNRLVKVQYADGVVVTYTYDKNGNLIRKVVSRDSQAGARSSKAK